MEQINAHVILSGDPKQLGPVVQCKIAEKLGYGNNNTLYFPLNTISILFGSVGTSMIERLMNSEPYQRNAKTNAYCSRF